MQQDPVVPAVRQVQVVQEDQEAPQDPEDQEVKAAAVVAAAVEITLALKETMQPAAAAAVVQDSL